jgi:hypothetical protein
MTTECKDCEQHVSKIYKFMATLTNMLGDMAYSLRDIAKELNDIRAMKEIEHGRRPRHENRDS